MADCPPPPLTLRLFGSFEAYRGEVPLPRMRRRKDQWLLALLALKPGAEVARTWLAGTLWPDSSPPAALANLRNALKDLRRALGPEAHRLHCPTTRTLSLDLVGADLDVREFDAAFRAGDAASLRRAVALYRGPLLEECAEEWVFQERQTREHAYLQALEALAAGALAADDPAEVERCLRRAVAVDPLRESTQRALMQVLATGGNYAAALLVYRELRARLHRELNAEPDPQTRALFQRLRTGAQEPTGGPDPAMRRNTAGFRPHPLPVPLTPLLGREREMAAAHALLGDPQVRLVSLTGPPGVGKTRLARQVAAELVDDFQEGVFFIELAPIRDPGLVASAIAQPLGVRESGSEPLVETLKNTLRQKQLLLVLDNFEQILKAAPILSELLAVAPALKVLVTSRAVLHLTGEREFSVPPLPVPDPQRLPPWETLSQYAAVELFLQRALNVKPGFALTGENASAVAEICRRVDGLPLAIELAASRIKLFSPEAMLSRMGSRLKLLTGGPRDVAARQQTLRNTIEWSYALLDESEKTLFRRLSVFVGGFTLEAAELVCNGESLERSALSVEKSGPTSRLNAHGSTLPLDLDILDGVASLVDKSLLRQGGASDGEPRFGMLETLREYGQECLVASGEEETIRQEHLQLFLALAEPASPVAPPVVLERLESELDNLRAAFEWAMERREVEEGLRLGLAMYPIWTARGYWTEGRERLGRVLALPAVAEGTAARAEAIRAAGWLAWLQGDAEAARSLGQECLPIARALGEPGLLYRSALLLSCAATSQGELADARRWGEESLAVASQLGDMASWFEENTLIGLTVVAMLQGDYETARSRMAECLEKAAGNPSPLTIGLQGLLARQTGENTAARALLTQAVAKAREIGDPRLIAEPLCELAELARHEGDRDEARALAEESLLIGRQIGMTVTIADSLNVLAKIAREEGDLERARARVEESLATVAKGQARHVTPGILDSVAGVAAARGECERAARLFGASKALREASGLPVALVDRPEYDRDVAAVRAALGQEAFAAAWAEGRSMTLDQAVTSALEGETLPSVYNGT
jgi:predicted ATPase/DNA-binding SARP family transcriptional activator